MKILQVRILPAFVIGALTVSAGAQEFFREFGTSRSSGGMGRTSAVEDVFTGNDPAGLPGIVPIDQMAQEDDYNMRLGNLDFSIAAGFGVEVNDNITLADSDPISDIILRPELDIEGLWRISENNKIRFGVGISFAKYMDHSEYDPDGPLISPTSAITWSARSGAFTFTVREALSHQDDVFDQPQISGVANYLRWENQASFQVDWEANEYTRISVGFDRFDLWTDDEFFSSQDRSNNTVYIRPSYQISPSFLVGLSTSMSWVDFKEDIQSDATVLLVGPYIQWHINDRTNLYLEVGYQQANFDGGSTFEVFDPDTGTGTGTFLTDTEDSSNIYAKMELTFAQTENVRHKLSATKTTEVGLGTNFYDLYHVEYLLDWKLSEKMALRPGVFWEYYENSGEFSEEATRIGAAVGFSYIYSDHLTLGIDYRFLKKDSNLEEADYTQNLGVFTLYYKF